MVVPAVSFSVGFLSLMMGVLNLGWLLDFVSLPILTGFMLGAGLLIAQAQVPILLGETSVGLTFIEQGKGILTQLGTAQPLTILIGVSSILILVILQVVGTRFGRRHFFISTFTSCRYAIVLIAFTGLSYGLNRDRLVPLWAVTGEIPTGLRAPQQPSNWLLVGLVAMKSLPVFFATAIEHLAVAKAFGRQHRYTIDPSTELTYLGVTNIVNGFFGGMPVGGTLSRTAVNSASNVTSPLSGVFTSAVVLLGIFTLKGAFFWIPQATIAAVIIVATVQVFPSFSVMKFHWKGSFIDFVSCQLVPQIALTASLLMGVGLALFFITVYTLVRARFCKSEIADQTDINVRFATEETKRAVVVQGGMCVIKLKNDVFFLNAFRIKKIIIDGLALLYARQPQFPKTRLWCHKKESTLSDDTYPINRANTLKVLILDFQAVSFIDTTTISMLTDLKSDIESFGEEGFNVELRFVGLCAMVQERFERCGWKLMDGGAPGGGDGLEGDRRFEDVRCAVEFPIMGKGEGWESGFDGLDKEKGGSGVEVRYLGF
jgi:sodium-independent sulfate anion transporter 11